MTRYHREVGPYEVRLATEADLPGARGVMLDTFYHEFGYGYLPEWHADVIDLAGTYQAPERHALFVATKGDEIVATTGIRSTGPSSPPHPAWLAERYPSGTTAQLFRVYVRPEHRRCGLARELVVGGGGWGGAGGGGRVLPPPHAGVRAAVPAHRHPDPRRRAVLAVDGHRGARQPRWRPHQLPDRPLRDPARPGLAVAEIIRRNGSTKSAQNLPAVPHPRNSGQPANGGRS